MKYLSIPTITTALHRIYEGNITHEHRTGTATSGLIQNYFPLEWFITTPEQIQEYSNKRPDFSIEKLGNDGKLVPHVFVEIKSLINSNFQDIMDQIYDTVLATVGETESGSAFVIAMKAGKIAFFEFHTYVDLLDEYEIPNYKGFVPLNYVMPISEFLNANPDASLVDYMELTNKAVVNVPQKVEVLKALGVESTSKIEYPHIWTLLNKDQEDYVHNLFRAITQA